MFNIVKFKNNIRRIQLVRFFPAFNFKYDNAVLGMSGNSEKVACLWCEGLRNEECGKIKSLGSLDYWYEKYCVENNS